MNASDIAAVVGCITGIFSLGISIFLGWLYRLEPYFRSVWNEIGSSITLFVKKQNERHKEIRSVLEKESVVETLPKLTNHFPELDNFNWKYDWRLKSLLSSYQENTEQLNSLIDEYNTLVYIVDFGERLPMLYGITFDDALEKLHNEVIEYEKLAKQYIDLQKQSYFEIRTNKKYQKNISRKRDLILRRLEKLKILAKKLAPKLDYYTRTWST